MESDQDASMDQASRHRSLYQPLGPNDFRLLEITPNQKTEQHELHCNLKIYNLDSPPKYEALSYAWAKNTSSREVLVNGEALPITLNLYKALQGLESRGKYWTLLWVDQICINTEDTAEKYQQLRRIRCIYQEASTLIVWLEDGQEIGDDDLTLKRILQSSDGTRAFYTLLRELGHSRIWRALGHVYAKSWFSRLWTYQEIALVQDVRLLFNGFEATLKQLRTAL